MALLRQGPMVVVSGSRPIGRGLVVAVAMVLGQTVFGPTPAPTIVTFHLLLWLLIGTHRYYIFFN